ncbi:hypothetical protein [Mycobacterium sp. E1214]|nr:hypothetical protein [Mycobacterium sp. E1214]
MTRVQCQKCHARSHANLCGRCTNDLRDMLVSLAHGPVTANGQHAAGWLEHLAEAALGLTRLGEIARRNRNEVSAMRLDPRCSELLDYVRSVLTEWTKDICKTHKLDIPSVQTTSGIALWLAEHVTALAADEGAGVAFREIAEIIKDIEKLVDRPAGRRFCGPCPSVLDDHDTMHTHGRRCGTALLASRDATEVTCPTCKATHGIDALMAQLRADLDSWAFTWSEMMNLVLPMFGERIPTRTFRSWIATGKLQATGYRRSDGTFVFVRLASTDKPAYRLGDVRRLREAKPQKSKTGAAARSA